MADLRRVLIRVAALSGQLSVPAQRAAPPSFVGVEGTTLLAALELRAVALGVAVVPVEIGDVDVELVACILVAAESDDAGLDVEGIVVRFARRVVLRGCESSAPASPDLRRVRLP